MQFPGDKHNFMYGVLRVCEWGQQERQVKLGFNEEGMWKFGRAFVSFVSTESEHMHTNTLFTETCKDYNAV